MKSQAPSHRITSNRQTEKPPPREKSLFSFFIERFTRTLSFITGAAHRGKTVFKFQVVHFFISGIGTEVGKTIVSAIFTEALEADYWKPIQSGDLDHSDTDRVKNLVSPRRFFNSAYRLRTPVSPHAAAAIDGIAIDIAQIKRPKTPSHLVVEGAGGLLVPLDDSQTIADLITATDRVVLVSKNYLGSINHSLLSLFYLRQKGIKPLLIFNGKPDARSEQAIAKLSGVDAFVRIPKLTEINRKSIRQQAERIRPELQALSRG